MDFEILVTTNLRLKYENIVFCQTSFMKFKSTGKLIIELDKFKDRLGIQDEYNRFFDLKKRVLDVAVKELQEKSNLKISWEKN